VVEPCTLLPASLPRVWVLPAGMRGQKARHGSCCISVSVSASAMSVGERQGTIGIWGGGGGGRLCSRRMVLDHQSQGCGCITLTRASRAPYTRRRSLYGGNLQPLFGELWKLATGVRFSRNMQNFRKANTLQVSKFTEKSDSNFSKLLKRQSKPWCAIARATGQARAPILLWGCASPLARAPGLLLLSPASGHAGRGPCHRWRLGGENARCLDCG